VQDVLVSSGMKPEDEPSKAPNPTSLSLPKRSKAELKEFLLLVLDDLIKHEENKNKPN